MAETFTFDLNEEEEEEVSEVSRQRPVVGAVVEFDVDVVNVGASDENARAVPASLRDVAR